jgi:xanthine dehydrogenase YagR molybdenum-binding subunit
MATANRVDGRLKVTGAARYSADYPADNMAYGYVVLSTIALGTVLSADVQAAQSAPGVLAIYTPFNRLPLAGNGGGPISTGHNWLPLQNAQVRYHGQIVGLVVAETFEQARDAAALVRLTYAAQPPAASFVDGIPNATRPGNIGGEPADLDLLAEGVESIDAALAASDVTVSATYSQPMKHHSAMEPHATTAVWQGENLTIYSGSQRATGHAQTIAGALGVPTSRVHLVSPHVGGGFGNRIATWGHSLLTAAAARALGRPVKTVLTREQTYTVTGNRSAVQQTVALGARRDGTLVAVKHDAFSSTSTSGGVPETPGHSSSRYLYRSENIHVGQMVVTLDGPAPTWMRAPGQESGSFALETALDELAVRLGMDPVALRLANNATTYPGRGLPWSSKHLDKCLRAGAQRFGWAKRDPRPGRRVDGDWLVGTGMATAFYPGERFPTAARVRFRADGTASVATATADLGTGMWTVLAMVSAESLGLPLDRVHPELGDSTLPSNFGAIASAGTASAGPAVRVAAEAAITALIGLAVSHERSPFAGLTPQDVRYDRGELVGPDRRLGFGELLRLVGVDGVEAVRNAGPGGEQAQYEFTSFGAHFCEVRVNRLTGEPRVTRFTTVIDAGAIVNDKAARSQIVGGVIFGISHALYEGAQVEPATGRIANANFIDYVLPVNPDIPTMDIHMLTFPDTLFNPLGVRGIGELGTVGAAAAVGNAVYHATGRRVRDLPITVDKLI